MLNMNDLVHLYGRSNDFYGGERESTYDLNRMQKIIIKNVLMLKNYVNYEVVWESSLKLLSISLKMSYPEGGEQPKFRKLVDSDTALQAIKAFFEFEEKELEAALKPFEEYYKNRKERQAIEDAKRQELYEKDFQKNLEAHFVKAGDAVMDVATKTVHIVEEVWPNHNYNQYRLEGNLYIYGVYKDRMTEKGTERKRGYVWLGKTAPAAVKAKK